MTVKQIREILPVDVVSQKNGIFTVKKSYFYGFSSSGETLASKIKELIPSAKIIDFGNHFHAFIGGAKTGSSQDSYFWCKFTVDSNGVLI